MTRITIRKNIDGEYEVPTSFMSAFPTMPKSSGLYFTDDKTDATETAKTVFGEAVVIVFRSGTYQK